MDDNDGFSRSGVDDIVEISPAQAGTTDRAESPSHNSIQREAALRCEIERNDRESSLVLTVSRFAPIARSLSFRSFSFLSFPFVPSVFCGAGVRAGLYTIGVEGFSASLYTITCSAGRASIRLSDGVPSLRDTLNPGTAPRGTAPHACMQTHAYACMRNTHAHTGACEKKGATDK